MTSPLTWGMQTIRMSPRRVNETRQPCGADVVLKVATLTSGVAARSTPNASSPSISLRVFSMQPATTARIPSRPRCSRTAQAPTTGAPGRVPASVYSCLTVRYGVSTFRRSSTLWSRTSRQPAGIVDIPILWGSTAIDETPERGSDVEEEVVLFREPGEGRDRVDHAVLGRADHAHEPDRRVVDQDF